MAEGKKSFVLYADLLSTVEKMPDDKAGELLKHILLYVNDMNPVNDDLLVQIAFEPIKNQLKRDLKKWEKLREKRSEAGKKSAEARAKKAQQNQQESTSVKSAEHSSTNSTVNDTVTVNVNDTVNDKEEYYYIIDEKLKLSMSDYEKLRESYSPAIIDRFIFSVEHYKGPKRKTYKNLYRVILSWIAKEEKEQKEKEVKIQSEAPKKEEYKYIRDHF